MLSLILTVLGFGLFCLGFGVHFGPGWMIVVGLLLLGCIPTLLVVNLFVGRR